MGLPKPNRLDECWNVAEERTIIWFIKCKKSCKMRRNFSAFCLQHRPFYFTSTNSLLSTSRFWLSSSCSTILVRWVFPSNSLRRFFRRRSRLESSALLETLQVPLFVLWCKPLFWNFFLDVLLCLNEFMLCFCIMVRMFNRMLSYVLSVPSSMASRFSCVRRSDNPQWAFFHNIQAHSSIAFTDWWWNNLHIFINMKLFSLHRTIEHTNMARGDSLTDSNQLPFHRLPLRHHPTNTGWGLLQFVRLIRYLRLIRDCDLLPYGTDLFQFIKLE